MNGIGQAFGDMADTLNTALSDLNPREEVRAEPQERRADGA